MPYYEAVAQLIPLLLLTLVVEQRLLPPLSGRLAQRSEGALRVFTGLVALAFVVAEAQVLWILRHGHVKPEMHDDIRASLVLGAAALVLPVLLRVGVWMRTQNWRYTFTSLAMGVALFAVLWVAAGLGTR